MFTNPSMKTDPRAWEESLESQLLEEELDLQLGLLKKHESSTQHDENLFPEVEAPMAELPHLKDDTEEAHVKDVVHKAELALALEETVLEETNMEAAVLCGVIALLLILPQLVHV